jgi:type IX secretion system PorP/SprF family membrane protein
MSHGGYRESMGKKIALMMVLLAAAATRVWAQYDVSFSNYWALQQFYNPATSGMNSKLNVAAAYSMQLTGFDNAPATMYAGADLPVFFIGPKHGVGVGFLNDAIGLFTHKKFYLQYAYHQKMLGGTLSLGVQGGFLSETFDGSKAVTNDASDPAIPTSSVTGSAFDLGAGLFYQHNKWYMGLSAMHCLSPVVTLGTDKTNELDIKPVFYLLGGYNIKLKQPFITVLPSVMVQSDLTGYRADITCRVAYSGSKHKMYGGVSYSPTNSVTFMLGGDFHGVSLGYSYELYTSAIGAMSGGHELVLGYQTNLDLFKKGKNKHKSVRIL